MGPLLAGTLGVADFRKFAAAGLYWDWPHRIADKARAVDEIEFVPVDDDGN
jgi:hypothetical protein